ncbi:hypothetical protein RI129_006200 [Pyrocoelia pectoralis]|uniref:Single domain-containing protein n=1 Tax=Pyrocoelia pectoralis TaxID=417401 RepID=A0AAN7ZG05_9COLE
MRVLLILTLFMGLASMVIGWTSLEEVKVEDTVCVSSDPSIGTLPKGESRLKDSCVRAICSPGLIDFAGCGVQSVPKPCYMGEEDLNLPYPECCPQPVCP